MSNKRIAVILSGCGYLDGAEIRESVLSILALDIHNVQYEIFSIDKTQHHVINHITGEEVNESRNTLVESARIARGDISNISELKETNFDALLLPGGFGVAKNFSSFAFEGHNASIDENIKQVLQSFHSANKPIGAICISPAILALCLGDKSPSITIGKDEGTASELEKLGAIHKTCNTEDCVIDEKNKLITTPAYMESDVRVKDVFTGISKLVDNLIKIC